MRAPASSRPLPEHRRPRQPRHLATLQENVLKGQMEDSIVVLQDEEGAAFIFIVFHKSKYHKKKKKGSPALREQNTAISKLNTAFN